MALSVRERYLVLAMAAVIVLYGLDRYAVSPLLEQRHDVAIQSISLSGELQQADLLLTNHPVRQAQWRTMSGQGLRNDAQQAESDLLAALGEWSGRSGLALPSIQPQRSIQDGELHQLVFQVTGNGLMQAVTRFLFELESSDMPVRVVTLTISARSEGDDELSVQIRISTIYRRIPLTAADRKAAGGS